MMIITSQNIHGIFTKKKCDKNNCPKLTLFEEVCNDSININIMYIILTPSSLSMHAKDYDHTVLTYLLALLVSDAHPLLI